MKKRTTGFTLVELIVGVAISAILMISVGIFASNGMGNIFAQQKVLQNLEESGNFGSSILSALEFSDKNKFLVVSSTGLLFKKENEYSKGGFTYLGEKTLSGSYCDYESGNHETKHIFSRTFIPFEELSENYFTNPLDTETGSLIVGADTYISELYNHTVLKNGNPIIGKGVFGDKFIDSSTGTGIYLNSPTGLAYGNNSLYISDTLNNRILYLSGSTIHKLLDESDGIKEPTGLLFESNKLYISNSGKGEILELSSESSSSGSIDIVFSPPSNIVTDRFELKLLSGAINLTAPNNVSNISFSQFYSPLLDPRSEDYIESSSNNINYYFANYPNLENSQLNIPIPGCTVGNTYRLDSGEPKKDVTTCTTGSTGSIATFGGTNPRNLNSANIYGIRATNIIGSGLNLDKTYYSKLSLFNGANKVYEKYFPYFQSSDGSINTKDDNTLKVLISGLGYPTGLSINTGNLVINDSWARKQITYDFDGTYISETPPQVIDFENIGIDKNKDYLLNTPIESLFIQEDSDNLLSIDLKYYKRYDCYNPDDSIFRSYLFKKNLKN